MSRASREPLRILLVGQDEPGALEHAWRRALSRVEGVEADLFAVNEGAARPANPSLLYRVVRRATVAAANRSTRRRLLSRLSSPGAGPDAVIVFKGMEFSRRSLEACAAASPGATWINLNPDDPTRLGARGSTNRDVLECLPFYDLYCTWSRSLATELYSRGCRRVLRIPFGWDADVHRPPSSAHPAPPEGVSFIGTWDAERESALLLLAGLDLRVFGANWGRVASSSPLRPGIRDEMLHGERLAREIHGSLLSINLLRPQNRDSHNMRTFEIPAMGGLMLTQHSQELAEFLQPERDCLSFETPRRMREQVERVLRNPAEFAGVRANGLRAVARHTYDSRARDLVGALVDMRSAGSIRRSGS